MIELDEDAVCNKSHSAANSNHTLLKNATQKPKDLLKAGCAVFIAGFEAKFGKISSVPICNSKGRLAKKPVRYFIPGFFVSSTINPLDCLPHTVGMYFY
ncbi:hypothetical protein ACU8KH_05819 [Lachancea thermotolerans]